MKYSSSFSNFSHNRVGFYFFSSWRCRELCLAPIILLGYTRTTMHATRTKNRTLRCPTCRREVAWEKNPHRPFCSERCRRIDLGNWADESYRIPAKDQDPAEFMDPDRLTDDLKNNDMEG